VTTDQPALPGLDPRTHARTADPDTSHEAARRLTSKATMMRTLLRTYDYWGWLTTDEAIGRAGYRAEAGAWKRISDLAMHGFIEDAGPRRPGLSGRLQIVRRITDKGRKALEET
jgi:hypothetical protein